MKKILFIGIIISVLAACGSKSDTPNFVPYEAFIKNDLADLDSTPLLVMAYTIDTSGKKIDSSIIEKAEFRKIANQFISPSINDKKLKKYFREDSYADEATGLFNFTYTTLEKDLPVTMVIAGTTLAEKTKFANLIVHKTLDNGQNQILNWSAGKTCSIITYDKGNFVSNKRYVWGM